MKANPKLVVMPDDAATVVCYNFGTSLKILEYNIEKNNANQISLTGNFKMNHQALTQMMALYHGLCKKKEGDEVVVGAKILRSLTCTFPPLRAGFEEFILKIHAILTAYKLVVPAVKPDMHPAAVFNDYHGTCLISLILWITRECKAADKMLYLSDDDWNSVISVLGMTPTARYGSKTIKQTLKQAFSYLGPFHHMSQKHSRVLSFLQKFAVKDRMNCTGLGTKTVHYDCNVTDYCEVYVRKTDREIVESVPMIQAYTPVFDVSRDDFVDACLSGIVPPTFVEEIEIQKKKKLTAEKANKKSSKNEEETCSQSSGASSSQQEKRKAASKAETQQSSSTSASKRHDPYPDEPSTSSSKRFVFDEQDHQDMLLGREIREAFTRTDGCSNYMMNTVIALEPRLQVPTDLYDLELSTQLAELVINGRERINEAFMKVLPTRTTARVPMADGRKVPHKLVVGDDSPIVRVPRAMMNFEQTSEDCYYVSLPETMVMQELINKQRQRSIPSSSRSTPPPSKLKSVQTSTPFTPSTSSSHVPSPHTHEYGLYDEMQSTPTEQRQTPTSPRQDTNLELDSLDIVLPFSEQQHENTAANLDITAEGVNTSKAPSATMASESTLEPGDDQMELEEQMDQEEEKEDQQMESLQLQGNDSDQSECSEETESDESEENNEQRHKTPTGRRRLRNQKELFDTPTLEKMEKEKQEKKAAKRGGKK